MRRTRLASVLVAVSVLWLSQAAPAAALLGWSQSGSPTSAQVGQATAFTLRVSNDNLLALFGVDDIGCVRVDVGSDFDIQSVTILAAPSGRTWLGSHLGSIATAQSDSGGGRLNVGQSVTFVVNAIPQAAGLHGWTTRVFRSQDCREAIPGTETLSINVSPAAATPTPTPVPTPTLAPVQPLPLPPLPSLPVPQPSLGVLPTVAPTPTPTSRPTPTPAGIGQEPRASELPGTTPGAAPPAAEGSPTAGAAPIRPPSDPDARPAAVRTIPGAGPVIGDPAERPPWVGFEAGEVQLGLGTLGFMEVAMVWIVPAATFVGPGLLLLIVVALQATGALAWVPAVRRLRGDDEPMPA